MLELDGLTTRYGAITAIRDLGLRVDEGEVVALIGPNGAGKTTTLASIAGLLTPAEGSVRLDGEDVTGTAPDEMLRRGVALVPEHRRIFADLTVAENLQVAGVTLGAGDRRRRLDEMAELFPVLSEKWRTHRAISPAVRPSSWPSPGPWSPTPASSSWMSRLWGWPRRWSTSCSA